MQVYEESLLEPLALDGLTVPVLRLGSEDEPPESELQVGETVYEYQKSYPSRGYAAVLPKYLSEQLAADKRPLLVERPRRYYVYLSAG